MRPVRPPKPPEGIDVPGLAWRPRAKHWKGYWIPRQDIAADGYPIKSRLLWPPADRPDAIPTVEEWEKLAAACEVLQGEMLTWRTAAVTYSASALFDDTVASLIRIYLNDPDSPFKNLRHHTAVTYERQLGYIEREIGHEHIAGDADHPGLTFRDFKRWHEMWSKPAAPNEPDRTSHAHERMKFTRIAFSFGTLLKLPGVGAAKAVLDEMEFKNPKRRSEIVDAAQAAAIRAEAHRCGARSIAFAQALQHDLGVRQKDVIGEMIPLHEPGLSEVHFGDEKWVVGFRWDELDANLKLTHRLSKSIRGKRTINDPEEGKIKNWRLPLYPSVMEELRSIAGIGPDEKLTRDMLPAKGPMVLAEHNGRPWRQKVFGEKWRKIARAAGVPDHVQNRDNRAGSATDAEVKGADIETIRKGLGHSKPETTRIYMRDEEAAEERIVKIRFGKTDSERA